jgi:hypothetical protein
MAYNDAVGFSSCFVQDHDIGEVVCLADFDEVFEHISSSVNSDRLWHDNFHLFLELNEALTWVSASGDQQFGVAILGLLILVIDVGSPCDGVIVGHLHFSDGFVLDLAQLSGDGRVVLNSILHFDDSVLFLALFSLL